MKYFIVGILLCFFLASCGDDKTVNGGGGGNNAPNTPSNPNPIDGATSVSRFITLTWSGGDPNESDTVRYDVVMGTTNPPTTAVATGTLSTSVDVGVVAENTVFYWRVFAKDNNNNYTTGPVWKFTTGD